MELKCAITSGPVLKYYDVSAFVKISEDACSVGLGECLLQENQIIAIASRSLNFSEQNNDQIVKEVLAISFGLKFHDHMYEKMEDIDTNHWKVYTKKYPKPHQDCREFRNMS